MKRSLINKNLMTTILEFDSRLNEDKAFRSKQIRSVICILKKSAPMNSIVEKRLDESSLIIAVTLFSHGFVPITKS